MTRKLSILTKSAHFPVRHRCGVGPLRFIDMFCGIGGFHYALSKIGAKCVFACDIDEESRRTYHANFGVQPAGDITTIDAAEIPEHDIFCAGFPCQPFSIIGDRAGFDDSRGTLFFDIARILKEKKPAAVIMENVRQLATHNDGRTLKRIVKTLEKIGYQVKHKILDARNFGLPQKRERVIIVAMLDMGEFDFPAQSIKMRPLSDILEPDKNVPKRYYASSAIREKRRRKHRAKISPAIWHENKGGNISSHPFSCALRAGASYNYLLVDGKRRLTPREMLRLQGFPDKFNIVCGDSQTRKQVGNAVPVPIIESVAQEVANVLNKNKKQYAKAS